MTSSQSVSVTHNIMNLLLICSLVSTSLSLPSIPNKRVPNSCLTLTGSSCVFPFSYKGVTHYQCTYSDSPRPWCTTQVDSSGQVVTNSWEDCDTSSLSSCGTESITLSSCTTESGPYSGQPCSFPFRYNGVTYTSCTTQDKSAAWCSTNTTLAGTHIPGYYGYCPSSCLGDQQNSCTPGTTFSQDCNTCVCNSLGQQVCTTTVCSTTSAPSTTCTTISGTRPSRLEMRKRTVGNLKLQTRAPPVFPIGCAPL